MACQTIVKIKGRRARIYVGVLWSGLALGLFGLDFWSQPEPSGLFELFGLALCKLQITHTEAKTITIWLRWAKEWALGCVNSPHAARGARRRDSRNLGPTILPSPVEHICRYGDMEIFCRYLSAGISADSIGRLDYQSYSSSNVLPHLKRIKICQ